MNIFRYSFSLLFLVFQSIFTTYFDCNKHIIFEIGIQFTLKMELNQIVKIYIKEKKQTNKQSLITLEHNESNVYIESNENT